MNLNQRSAGVLLHVTSLPGPHGIGDLGPEAFHFVDWLASAGQRLWQVLPTTPVGPGDSPYQSVSAFAGSPLMVALEPLVAQGWLAMPELPQGGFDAARVDYARVAPWRIARLRDAAQGFFDRASDTDRAAFADWCVAQSHWLADHVLFMALEHAHAGAPWWHWPQPLREREPAALARAQREQAGEIRFWQFVQWCFDRQWAALKAHANARGVFIMGDLPIFIAHHSADCWARPDLYQLDADFQPTVVAGVPPDDFSADGQRWGNPLYRWDRMAAEGYAWWIARLRRALTQADVAAHRPFPRLRGLLGSAGDQPDRDRRPLDARPRQGAVRRARRARSGRCPSSPRTWASSRPTSIALRDGCGFPGMRILQFAFGEDARNPYLPHHHAPASVVYTGTHDNDTTRGWWASLPRGERHFAGSYLATDSAHVHWALIRAALDSVANTAIVPDAGRARPRRQPPHEPARHAVAATGAGASTGRWSARSPRACWGC